MTNLFGSFTSPDTPSLRPPATAAEFSARVSPFSLFTYDKVSSLALDLFYIGLGVLISVYVANVCWIVSGERISRRIRGYPPSRFVVANRENTFKRFFVKMLPSSTD